MALANALGANVGSSRHIEKCLKVESLISLNSGQLEKLLGDEVQNVFLALAIPWAIQCTINRPRWAPTKKPLGR